MTDMPRNAWNAIGILLALLLALSPYAAWAQSSTPSERQHHFRHVSLPVLIGGQAADTWTTTAGLSRGLTEQNRRIYGAHPSNVRLVTTKSLITLGNAWALDRLSRHHPRMAHVGAWIVGGVGAFAAWHNARELQKP